MPASHYHFHYHTPKMIFVFLLLLLSLILIYFSSAFNPALNAGENFSAVKGEVVEILSERAVNEDAVTLIGAEREQELLVTLFDSNKQVKVRNDFTALEVGDEIFARPLIAAAGGEETWEMVEVSRTKGIFWIALIFAALVILVSGKKGFNALVGLVFTFAVIFSFIIPQILYGRNAVLIALTGSLVILLATLYISHGAGKKTLAALLGIALTLLFVGIAAQIAVAGLNFTGFGSEEAAFLKQASGDKINFIGLLIAGVIIAAIGVLDDIAVTQAATVFALAEANSGLAGWNLFRKAMDVGRDHISAVINTLVLAYTGAALPLVLLFSSYQIAPGYAISAEVVAEEIIRTLISSAGLVLAVPITTGIAVVLGGRKVK
ncbi:MAG: YibE/F family protein [Patescibacteria group bacterium]